jgi:hypothetical protein
LVAAAGEFASESHIDHIMASIYPSLRETNRFFARLGFAPIAVRRIAPVSVMRRQLDNDRTASVHADTVRRRTRIGRPVPPQRRRRVSVDRIES